MYRVMQIYFTEDKRPYRFFCPLANLNLINSGKLGIGLYPLLFSFSNSANLNLINPRNGKNMIPYIPVLQIIFNIPEMLDQFSRIRFLVFPKLWDARFIFQYLRNSKIFLAPQFWEMIYQLYKIPNLGNDIFTIYNSQFRDTRIIFQHPNFGK